MTSKPASLLVRLVMLLSLLAAVAALSFGYLGWLHPAFDSFSHFRIHLAVLLVAGVPLLWLLRYRPEALFALVFGVTALVQTTGMPSLPGTSQVSAARHEEDVNAAVYRLLHMNLRYDNESAQAISLIGELRPDIVTLNEVSQQWVARLGGLRGSYPYGVVCETERHIGGVAILSRRPLAEGTTGLCGDNGSFARAQVDIGGRIVEVATLHLGWPWPFEQPWQVMRVQPLLAQIGSTAIIAGDFNAVPWSNTARQVESASKAQILRGIGPTWLDARAPGGLRGIVGLPIDNMLTKGGVIPLDVGTVGDSGSDHLPVMLEFLLLPQEKPLPVHHAVALAAASERKEGPKPL